MITNDDAESCEHAYHVLEQQIEDNEYEELDTKKKGRSQQVEEEDVNYTLEGPAVEGEGPGGGDSTSEEHDKSVLISKNGN